MPTDARFNNAYSFAPPSSGYAQRVSEADWSKYELGIRLLHSQSATRAEILMYLADTYQFYPSAGQLARQLKQWRLHVYKTHPKHDIVVDKLSSHLLKWFKSQLSPYVALSFLESAAASAACQRRFSFAFTLNERLFNLAKDFKDEAFSRFSLQIMVASAANCGGTSTKRSLEPRTVSELFSYRRSWLDVKDIHEDVKSAIARQVHQNHVLEQVGQCNQDCLRPISQIVIFTVSSRPEVFRGLQLDAFNLRVVFRQHLDQCLRHFAFADVLCTIDISTIKTALMVCVECLVKQMVLEPEKRPRTSWPCNETEKCLCYQEISRYLNSSPKCASRLEKLCFEFDFGDCKINMPKALLIGILTDILVQYDSRAWNCLKDRHKRRTINTSLIPSPPEPLPSRTKLLGTTKEILENDADLGDAIVQALKNILGNTEDFRAHHNVDDVSLTDWLSRLSRLPPKATDIWTMPIVPYEPGVSVKDGDLRLAQSSIPILFEQSVGDLQVSDDHPPDHQPSVDKHTQACKRDLIQPQIPVLVDTDKPASVDKVADPTIAQAPGWSATSSLRSFFALARCNQADSEKSSVYSLTVSDTMSIVSRLSSSSSWSFKRFIDRQPRAASSTMSLDYIPPQTGDDHAQNIGPQVDSNHEQPYQITA